jgi:hypothetical protein
VPEERKTKAGLLLYTLGFAARPSLRRAFAVAVVGLSVLARRVRSRGSTPATQAAVVTWGMVYFFLLAFAAGVDPHSKHDLIRPVCPCRGIDRVVLGDLQAEAEAGPVALRRVVSDCLESLPFLTVTKKALETMTSGALFLSAWIRRLT